MIFTLRPKLRSLMSSRTHAWLIAYPIIYGALLLPNPGLRPSPHVYDNTSCAPDIDSVIESVLVTVHDLRRAPEDLAHPRVLFVEKFCVPKLEVPSQEKIGDLAIAMPVNEYVLRVQILKLKLSAIST